MTSESNVPITPENIPKTKYKVPISLWLVEQNHLSIKYVIFIFFVYIIFLNLLSQLTFHPTFSLVPGMYYKKRLLRKVSETQFFCRRSFISQKNFSLFYYLFNYLTSSFWSFIEDLNKAFSVVLNAKMIAPTIAVNKIKPASINT